MNSIQENVRLKLKKLIACCFNDRCILSLGFGSFWQKYSSLRLDSDIDFFILLRSFPSIEDVLHFCNCLSELQKGIPYVISCHLFVGAIQDLLSGEDNVMRILNIYSYGKSAPVVIAGDVSTNLLNQIKDYEENIKGILRSNLFRTTRFFLQEFVSGNGHMSEAVLRTKYKQLIRFAECYELANDMYFHNQETEVVKQMKIAIEDQKIRDLNAENIYDLVKQYNDLLLR